MMSEPDWSLLPDQPRLFFGLPEAYSRRDLKRSYGRLIKVYRPEQSPDEFRKIRDAFERLDSWLKFQEQNPDIARDFASPVAVTDEQDPVTDGNQQDGTNIPATDSARSSMSLEQRLQDDTVEGCFLKLATIEQKQPVDFIHLALLSEVIPGQPQQSLLQWLTLGLKQFPHSAELLHFTSELCEVREFQRDVTGQLSLLCEVLPPQHRLGTLSPLWDWLLKKDFPAFRLYWQKLIQPYRDEMPEQVVSWLVPWLTAAVWVADESWVQGQLQFVERHHEFIYGQLEYELELVHVLRKFHKNNLYPFHSQSVGSFRDQLIDYYRSTNLLDRQTYHVFLHDVRNEFLGWSQDLEAKIPKTELHELARVMEWTAQHERLYRHGDFISRDPQEVPHHLNQMLEQIRQQEPKSLFYHLGFYAMMLLIAVIISFLMIGPLFNSFDSDIITFVIIFANVVAWVITYKIYPVLWEDQRQRSYHSVIRPLVQKLFLQSRMEFPHFHSALTWILEHKASSLNGFQTQAVTMMLDDPALRIYRAALDFEE